MKNYSLQAQGLPKSCLSSFKSGGIRLAFGLLYSLIVSTSIYSSTEPKLTPVVNATWGNALKTATKETYVQASGFLRYVKLPSIALNYAIPAWKISRFFNLLGNTDQAIHGFTTSYVLTAISLRYKKQIIESCGDEETAKAWMGTVPFIGLFLPQKISALAALTSIVALQAREWRGY